MANALQLIGGSVLKDLESPTKERKETKITGIAKNENDMTQPIEIFGRKLVIVDDVSNTCKKCALADICNFSPMPCKDSNGNTNRRFELIK